MKRFVYLFQVERDLPRRLEEAAGPESDIVFLSYGAKSPDPRSIYYPSSSWTQGRNRLLKEVADRPYQYFVFGDADVRLELTRRGARNARRGTSPWRTFEQFLREYEPAVGVPRYLWHLSGASNENVPVQTLRFFDPVLNAFHREALLTLLPYYDLMDPECADYSGSFVCSIAAELYPGNVLQTNDVRVDNPLSLRAYTERIMAKPETFYLASLRDPGKVEDYRRMPEWERLAHPALGDAKPRPGSYVVSEADLALRYRLDHRLWARKRELMEMPRDTAFFSEAADTERAAQWRHDDPGRIRDGRSLVSRLSMATRSIRGKLGLVRTGKLFGVLKRIRRDRYVLRTLAERRERRRRPAPSDLWREWRADPGRVFAFGSERESRLFDLLGHVFNRLEEPQIVFVEVGTGQGEVLGAIEDLSLTRKRVIAVGIDPEQTRGFAYYPAYVLGRVGEDALRLSTVLKQYGLGERTLHYLRIATGDIEACYGTLADHSGDCLFLTVRASAGGGAVCGSSWPEARRLWEGRGLRLLNVTPADASQVVEATFANEDLLRALLPDPPNA